MSVGCYGKTVYFAQAVCHGQYAVCSATVGRHGDQCFATLGCHGEDDVCLTLFSFHGEDVWCFIFAGGHGVYCFATVECDGDTLIVMVKMLDVLSLLVVSVNSY